LRILEMKNADRVGIILILWGLFLLLEVSIQTIPISGFMIGLGTYFLMWNVCPWNKDNG